jgi:FkbM family methyltransferase
VSRKANFQRRGRILPEAIFMISVDYLKSRIIGSPLQTPLVALKSYLDAIRGRKENPDLALAIGEEEAIHVVLRKLLSRTSNCIDIGCHLGSVLHELTVIAPRGRHMAFEPTPLKAGWLKRKFPKVEVHCMALGEEVGEVSFFINQTRTGYSSLVPTYQDPNVDQIEEIKVPCDRLDNIVPEGRKVDLIKIDVEGFELPVIRGGAKLFARDRPYVVFESMNCHFEKFGYTPRDMYDHLNSMGYSIYLFTEFLAGGQPLDIDRYDAAHYYPFRAFNFLAVPKK